MYQYMRIQGREDSYITKYPKGVFSLCWNLVRDKVLKPEEEQLFISIDKWFKEHLPEPEPCKNQEKVITFFKTETTAEMQEKIGTAVRIMDKYRHPYDIVYTNYVGQIIYEDEWQVAVGVRDGEMI